ncbi:MAG: hypothetical protein A3K19_13575 [Lentisphaerae bacterium RIFOXYB12_FULL_65_16]|nr:MAG: hypothetical protein A3K18_05375 [Lentisphaerae bacterium RIFOXYA12_64_32]OGV93066.1 MAG: hypothetical protein A3K19_13575 [Lentisphaerae bacterium RIFOXYB12_FULL_65_16]
MKAAFNTEPRQFEIRDVPKPEPAHGEVLVRVRACGICGADKHEFAGKRPARIAGHEFAGEVEGLGPGVPAHVKVGQRVCVAPITTAGVLGYSRPGGFAEYCTAPASALVSLPDHVSFADGALTEPVAVGVHASTRTTVEGRTCVVFGAGTIGLVTALCCRAKGAREVWIVDVQQRYLEVAAALGLRSVNSESDSDLKELPQGGVEVSFECVGNVDAVLDAALRVTCRSGSVVVLTTGHTKGIPTHLLLSRQLTVYGSMGTTMDELQEAVGLIASGRVPVKPLTNVTFPLGRMNEAFAATVGAQKVMVTP